MRFVKPLDIEIIEEICTHHSHIITVEENVVLGGAGSAVNEIILNNGLSSKVYNLGIPDKTIMHGSQDELLSEIGLDEKGIRNTTLNFVGKSTFSKQN